MGRVQEENLRAARSRRHISARPSVRRAAGWTALPDWRRIASRNEALIRSCALMIANLTPFRGPSADVGTVYEIGFMRALGRPVYGYATTATPFTQRTLDFAAAHGGATAGADG